MISIVTAYYNRKKLFINTLNSIKCQNYNGELEVIAVDDGSDFEERLEDLMIEFPFLKVIRLEKENKWYKNSCIPFNIGFKAAKGDKIIIQNPECLHLGNILNVVETLQSNQYFSFGCFSLGKYETENLTALLRTGEIDNVINKHNYIVTKDGENGWYNHSLFRPNSYHFCTAILKNDLIDLGGFDERFANGVGVDDDELIYRIHLKGMRVFFKDNQIVLHQNHYNERCTSTLQEVEKIKSELYATNYKIFQNVTTRSVDWRVGYFEGQEKIDSETHTEGLLSYRNLFNIKMKIICNNKIKRKIAVIFLSFLSKL